MFGLCTECRRAFNIKDDNTLATTTITASTCDAPASKRAKVQENSHSLPTSHSDSKEGGHTEEEEDDGSKASGGSTRSCDESEEAQVCESLPTASEMAPGEVGSGGTNGPTVVPPVPAVVTSLPCEPPIIEPVVGAGEGLGGVRATSPSTGGESELKRGEEATCLPVVCSGCLGLLYDSFTDGLSSAISDELARANYEPLSTFSLSISTPLSLTIRQSGVVFHLKEISNKFNHPQEAYVKELLRYKLYSKLKEKLHPLTADVESPFQIVLKLDHSRSSLEYRLASDIWPHAFQKPRRRHKKWSAKKKARKDDPFNTASIARALSEATAEDFKKGDFLSATELCAYTIGFTHSSLFVGGRYSKYSRALPQTPWIIAGVRKVATSVQELICDHLTRFTRSSDVKFSSSGREDCDVRMLGNGRPFLVELINPRKTALDTTEVDLLQTQINSSSDLVEVRMLQVLTKSDATSLKEGEAEKRKEYRALVWAPEEVTQEVLDRLGEMRETVIHQKTPIRVLHRRTLATRDRIVHEMRGELVDPHHFHLLLTTQAGTYVKEFVHGDFGRTRPNLRTIMGQEVDILTLDVCNVLLDWPPPHK